MRRGNQYWPAEYLTDRSGRVRQRISARATTTQTENTIRKLLGKKAERAGLHAHSRLDTRPDQLTPESYLGYERLEALTPTRLSKQDKMARL